AIVSTTREPESDDVTKKIATRITAMVEVTAGRGRNLKNSNRPTETSSITAEEICPAATVWSRIIAVLPNTVLHRKVNSVGMNRTATMNSRTVRPREIRAMNMPTKGDQEIHHAQ